jgi:sugar lactone lactonase YvrE
MPTVAALRSDARLLAAPARLAVDGEGRRYVTDPAVGRLLVRDVDGRLVRVLDGLGRPLGVAVDTFGVAYVGDEQTGSVSLYDLAGHFLRKLGGGDGEFALPGHVAVDPGTGVVYVVDGGRDEVKTYRDGQLVARFGGSGSAAGQFSFPTGIHVSAAGEVFVADQNNDRVQVFDRDGAFLRCFGKGGMSLTPKFGRAQGLAGDGRGRVYVADAFQGTVKVFDAAGVLLGAIGQFGDRTGELRLPQSLAVDTNGRLLVVSTGNSRVEVFGLDGYSDPHVLEADVRLRLPIWPQRRPSTRDLLAIVEVPGRAATEIVASSLTANGVAARGGSVRGGRFWALFDHASVVATLPPEGGPVVVRGELGDGSEFEAIGRPDEAPSPPRFAPPVPARLIPTRPGAAVRGVWP